MFESLLAFAILYMLSFHQKDWFATTICLRDLIALLSTIESLYTNLDAAAVLNHIRPRFLCHSAKVGREIACETKATSMHLTNASCSSARVAHLLSDLFTANRTIRVHTVGDQKPEVATKKIRGLSKGREAHRNPRPACSRPCITRT